MEYKVQNEDKLELFPDVGNWLTEVLKNSKKINKEEDERARKKILQRWGTPEICAGILAIQDKEKESVDRFIEACVYFYEEYLITVLELGYIDEHSASKFYKNLKAITAITNTADSKRELLERYKELKYESVVHFDWGGARDEHDHNKDWSLRDSLYFETNHILVGKSFDKALEYYEQNKTKYSFIKDYPVDVDTYIGNGMYFFALGVTISSSHRLSTYAHKKDIPSDRYNSIIFNPEKKSTGVSYSNEAELAAGKLGRCVFNVKSDTEGLSNISSICLHDDFFDIIITKFSEEGKEEELFKMFFDLGIIEETIRDRYFSKSNHPLLEECRQDFLDTYSSMSKKRRNK